MQNSPTPTPITSVLVANRGEIARRVHRTARALGMTTVAVFSDADAEAPHTREADAAVRLPGNTPAETYLRGDLVIAAAKAAGADAIHPGYGFLSENAGFARDVIDAGLIWVGPPVAAIEAMGSKIEAKKMMGEAGVPMLSDLEPADVTEDMLPVLVKASAGGGGRGMRIVRTLDSLHDEIAGAQREAKSAFGDDAVFCERYLERGRHIEVQIVADSNGTVWAVGERECSIQRRHQKVIEEAPSPLVERTPGMREALYTAARDAASAIGYTGAGTVEFLATDDGEFFFLEMNTRLQVEHPVTEETAGIDLVLQQFKIAEGEVLEFTEDPAPRGHAFEFRINGEDAGRGFLPAPGTITGYHEPTGPGVRMDSGVEQGDTIGGQFDSMLAKLIVWGEDRDQALARSARALAEYKVEGMATVLPFHQHIVTNPAYVGDGKSFDIYTKWIEEEWDNPIEPWSPTGAPADDDEPVERKKVVVEVDGRRVEVSLPGDLAFGGSHAGGTVRRKAKSRTRGGAAGAAASGDAVSAPMQGTVVKVAVEEGQEVSAGDLVAVLEAMKMENPVTAHKDGVITDLAVDAGAAVTQGTVLCEIK
ncbi:biotin/lipoyl-binding protein [Dietzia schimae]|nr:biotin carboxylase N-terminal domain-containing protein [Dietzia kunjamensis]MBB1015263.1 biotin/lipoyl-binding protein [Dietzia kunjamensis subsp. schimae]